MSVRLLFIRGERMAIPFLVIGVGKSRYTEVLHPTLSGVMCLELENHNMYRSCAAA